MICDAHSHLLHEMDSGATSPTQSAILVKATAAQGVKAVILCPTYQTHIPISHFLIKRYARLDELRTILHKDKSPIMLIPSCEVPLFREIIFSSDLEKLLIPGTRYLPVTLPIGGLSKDILYCISYLIQKRQIYPYFLHTERYITFYSSEEKRQLFQIKNCLWGVTMRALQEDAVATDIMRLYATGKTILPSSNAHDPSFRSPDFSLDRLGLSNTYGEKVFLRIEKRADMYIKKLMPYWKRHGF